MAYEDKFKEFIRMCEESKAAGVEIVLIAYPWVLGDTYDEVMESLSRLAEADLQLAIAKPNQKG